MRNRSWELLVLCLGLSCVWGFFSPHFEDPNILLITIDTLRLDRLGTYGSPVPGMPNVDAIAKESVVFDRYYSVTNCTVPSHLAMLTGKSPNTLRIYDNEKYDIRSIGVIPSYLQARGYQSHAIASAFFFQRDWLLGLDKSFDSYQAPSNVEFKAEEVKENFQKLIPQLKQEKFFCWLHFYDPHTPYDPPEDFKRMFPVEKDAGREIEDIKDSVDRQWLNERGIERTYQARSLYRGEVAYADSQIGEVMRLLKENDLTKNTVIFFVADHGELLGSHGLYYEHGSLYEKTIHVPLIVYGNRFHSHRIPDFVSGLDITPTILDLAGIKIPSDLEGLSLLPVLNGKSITNKRFIYSKSAHNVELAILNPPFKLIHNKSGGHGSLPYELYDVMKDPYERSNLILEKPDVAKTILSQANPAMLDPEIERLQFPMGEEEIEKLKALGYARE